MWLCGYGSRNDGGLFNRTHGGVCGYACGGMGWVLMVVAERPSDWVAG